MKQIKATAKYWQVFWKFADNSFFRQPTVSKDLSAYNSTLKLKKILELPSN